IRAAFGDIEIIIRQLAPTSLQLPAQLFPLTFDLVFVHRDSPCLRRCVRSAVRARIRIRKPAAGLRGDPRHSAAAAVLRGIRHPRADAGRLPRSICASAFSALLKARSNEPEPYPGAWPRREPIQ